MVTSTSPSKGVQTDITINKHDPDFARESVNGRFTTVSSNMTWESIKPFKLVEDFSGNKILGAFNFQGQTYYLSFSDTYFYINRYNPETGDMTQMFYRNINDFGFSENYPIRSCTFWTNVSETKLKLYFTDGNVNPWVIDILDATSQTGPISDLAFSPRVGTPLLDLDRVVNGGSVLCGKYYYAIMAYKASGVSTDWMMMHSAVEVPNQMPIGYTALNYQAIQGENNTFNSTCKVVLKLLNINEFIGWSIKIAAFYALDESKLDTGRVFYDGQIGTGEYTHLNNVALEDVLPENVLKNTISIKKVGVMASNGEINVLGDIEINEFPPAENGTFDNLKFIQRPTVSLKKLSDGLTTGIQSHIILDNLTQQDIWQWPYPALTYIVPAQATLPVDANTPAILSPKTWRKTGDTSWNQTIKNYSPGFKDYTNPHISFRNKVYRPGEPIRLALVPFDLYGKPTRPIWLNDLAETPGSNMVPTCQLSSATNDNNTWVQKKNNGSFFLDEVPNAYPQTPGYQSACKLQLDYNWIEILGIDLKDFQTNGVPNISGFSIVQAEAPIKRILSEGIFTATIKDRPSIIPIVGDLRKAYAGGGWILLYSPEFMFKDVKPSPGDKIFATKQTVPCTWYQHMKEFSVNMRYETCTLLKLYNEKQISASISGVGTIEKVIELPNLIDVPKITVEGLGEIRNGGKIGNYLAGIGNKKALLIKLKQEAGLYDYFASDEATLNYNFMDYWTYRIESPGYGFASQSDSDLENTTYNFVGHYQPVDQTFLSSIHNNGEYKCDISLYGGQYYGNILEIIRAARYSTDSELWGSNVVFFPVLSKINLRMRSGSRYSKDRTLGNLSGSYANNNGIGLATNRGKLEDFLIGSSYLSANSGREALPVPNDFEIATKLTNVVFWSEKQALQGNEDYFRKIYASSYQICDVNGKNVTGLEFTKDKLIVFQKNAIGFLPYNERMLASMANGPDLVVSYGSVFPKYESIDRKNGIAHNLMKAITPIGIAFYNSIDKTFNILGDVVENFAKKMGVTALFKNDMTNVSRLYYGKEEGRLLIQSDNKLLEISLDPSIVVNGILKLDNTDNVTIFPLGEKIAIADRLDQSSDTLLYVEDTAGTIKLNNDYSILLIVGSDKRDIFKKIFDNLIIHTAVGLQPETAQFFIDNLQSVQENLANNEYVILNGSTIYMAIPFIDILNAGGVLNHTRVADSSVCVILLKSQNRFAIESLICEYRNSL